MTNDKTENTITVVIPTLGEDSLVNTVSNLLNGIVIPDEILLCIPKPLIKHVCHLESDIIKTVATDEFGQVYQRLMGFFAASKKMVLQVDSDMVFSRDTIQNLRNTLLSLGPGNAVGPVIKDINSKQSIYGEELKKGIVGFFVNLYDYVFHGAPFGLKKMGVVTKIGSNYSVNPNYINRALFKVDWLAGGCVMCFKEDLILENYFLYPGKAYGEDVIHSLYRKKKGQNMFVDLTSFVYTDKPIKIDGINTLSKVLKFRNLYIELTNGPFWKLEIYRMCMYIYLMIKKIRF